MALGQHLELRHTQSLVLTPQLQQLLRLVQMSNIELAAHIDAELESNPLLEKSNENEAPAEDQSWSDLALPSTGPASSTLESTQLVAEQRTLHDHVLQQIALIDTPKRIFAAARIIVGELQDDGYIRSDLREIRLRHGIECDEMKEALKLVQSCEPTGVGARDLSECLSLQLVEKGMLCADMQALLERLADIPDAGLERLSTELDLNNTQLFDFISVIRSLDPKPGEQFSSGVIQFAVPDVFVRAEPHGGYNVELNTENLPRVLVNNVYSAHINTLNDEERAYISECRTRANWLIKAMEQRAGTILGVVSELVSQQAAFFAGGVQDLRPLTQRDVAEKLNIHESTVSRASAGKFLSCKQGNFPFQFFFTGGVAGADGEKTVAATAVQEQIRTLILNEDQKKTLSDDKLVTILKDRGVSIARRTVTKYREALKLPSSVQRRRLNALKKR